MRSILELVQPHLVEAEAYTPGRQPTGEGWIKLNTNEAPYPPSPTVLPAIEEAARRLPLYPNPTSQPLREAIAGHHGLDPSQVIVGNGSDDILNLLARTFAGSGHLAAQAEPSYSLYPVLTLLSGGRMSAVPIPGDFTLPVDRLVATGGTILFITCPNAPLGIRFPNTELAELADRFDGVLVIDEAYAEFASGNALELLRAHPRVVITRTFSKAYALAGLRVGYGLASAGVIDYLDRVRDSYNVNRLSQAGALAAIKDTGYYREAIRGVVSTRDRVRDELQQLGWSVYPSETNFLMAAPVDGEGRSGSGLAASLFQYLEARRILVRYFPKHPLTEQHLRISIGSPSQMDRLIEEIRIWQKSA